MSFIINPYQVQPSSAYGTLTTAWITATGEINTTILDALNTLESDLNTYGLTSKMKALYPFVGGTAAKHKFNFMDARDLDAAFRLVFSGGWTHSSTGAKPNGTNAYADTKLISSSVLTNNNYHLSHYSRTQNSSADAIEIGAENQPDLLALDQYYAGVSAKAFAAGSYPNSTVTINNTDTLGYMIGSRTSSTLAKVYMDGVYQAQQTNTNSNSLPNRNLFLAANNNAGTSGASQYSDKECAFATIGSSLTDTEAANLYTAVQAFQTTLSRNV